MASSTVIQSYFIEQLVIFFVQLVNKEYSWATNIHFISPVRSDHLLAAMHSVLIGFCESFPTINSHFNCCPPPLCISSLSSAYSHQISLHGATLTTQVKDIQSSLYIMQNQLQNIAPSAPHVSNGNPPTPPTPSRPSVKHVLGVLK